MFGEAVVHAQNRLWQLELQRRLGAGRLAEVLGSAAEEVDEMYRTLGFYRAAERSYELIENERDKRIIAAYVKGLNAYIEKTAKLPMEFQLFRLKPEPFVRMSCWFSFR